MSAIKLNSSGGGSITISPASTASNLTLTAPAQTGTIGLDGPAFSAYANTTQSVTAATFTKIAINTEHFDTNSCFDTTTNRFTPNVAGYYQVNGTLRFSAAATSGFLITLYKNGANFIRGSELSTTALNGGGQVTLSALVYLNGSTDYIELYGYISGSGPNTFAYADTSTTSFFSASLVRAA